MKKKSQLSLWDGLPCALITHVLTISSQLLLNIAFIHLVIAPLPHHHVCFWKLGTSDTIKIPDLLPCYLIC